MPQNEIEFKEIKNDIICLNKYLFTHIHGSTIHNSQKVKQPTHLLKDDGQSSTHEKEWKETHAVLWKNLKKLCAKWKKTDIKDHVVYDPTYMKHPE